MAHKWAFSFAVILATALSVSASSVSYYVDTPSSAFFQNTGGVKGLSKELHAAVPSAVMGLNPTGSITDEISQQLNSIVKPQPFSHPRLYLSINLLGDAAGVLEAVKGSFPQSNIQQLASDDLSAVNMLHSLASLAAANKGAKFASLGAAHAQTADAALLETRIKDLAAALGTSYATAAAPGSGKLQLGENADLDCSVEEDKAAAADIANLYSELTSALGDAATDEGQYIVEVTVTSLHGLALKYGASSDKVVEAVDAVLSMISTAVQQNKDLSTETVIQVNSIPLSGSESTTTILGHVQRTLKQEVTEITSPVAAAAKAASAARAKKFSIKAAAYGSFILLLYFTFAGIYCMCTMKFKQDSLLYPSQKNE